MRALASRDFALLWSAQVISGFGDRITVFALAAVTWQMTQSAIPTALAFVISSLSYGLFGFVAGAIADAVGHRRALVACDLARMFLIGAIPVTLALGLPLVLAFVLVFVATLFSAVFAPARMAIIPAVVAREYLSAGNALTYSSDRVVEIAGALVAGVLVALLGVVAFYVDAASFGASAALLLGIRVGDPRGGPLSWTRLLKDSADGLRILRDNTVLRANTVFALTAQLGIPVFNGLLPVLVFREYSLGAQELGLAQAALAVGSIGMGLMYPASFGRLPKGPMIALGFALYGLGLLVLAQAGAFAAALGVFVLLGAFNVIFLIPNVTLFQEVTPPSFRARVFSARIALRNLSWLPVIAVTGAAADRVGVPIVLAAAGVFMIIIAVGGFQFRAVREVA